MRTCFAPRWFAAAALVLSPGLLARAPEPVSPTAVERTERLKQHYLHCDRMSTQRVLSFSEAASCSLVAEQLLKEHFDSNLATLLAWWRAARSKPAVAEAAAQVGQ